MIAARRAPRHAARAPVVGTTGATRPTARVAQVSSPKQDRSPNDALIVDVCGPAEWVVGKRHGGPALHVYQIGPGDWLVSEVGRPTEGRRDRPWKCTG